MTKEPTEGSSRPKRTRRQVRLEEPSAPDAETTTAVKRRRLNAAKPTTSAPPKPAPAPSSAPEQPGTRSRRSARPAPSKGKADAGADKAQLKPAPAEASPAVKYRKLGLKSRPSQPAPAPKSENVYDVPDSEDELNSSTPEPVDQPEDEAEDSEELPPPKKKTGGDLVKAPSPEKEIDTKPKRRGRPPKAKDPIEAPPAKESVAARLAKSVVDSPRPEAPQLKGILTPQKNRVLGRPRKTVAFDGDKEAQHAEVYFEDLPSKSKSTGTTKKPTKAQPKAQQQASEDGSSTGEASEDDDEVCTICLKPDSEPPNEIIFCDHCDMAVHQACYNVPVIPEGDWVCRNCSQEDVLSGTKPAAADARELPETIRAGIPSIANFEQHLHTMQRVLLDRCSGSRRIRLQGQSEAYEKAFQLVEQTVLAGEGNSMMVIGARGCGKTTLVETIISDLAAEHRDEFHVVRLNGFIHTDDKLALKEIWRQLGREMDLEDELVNKTNNYADTMASLLALLSHPEEITGAGEEGVTSKSVIFVIDEFDLFATHARQTLLYNLFDIAQARKAPIAVLGLTTKIDVVESLEKRVKSRFSHRYVYMSMPKTLQAYWDACRQGLMVDEEDLLLEGFDTRLKGLNEFHQYWEKKIKALRKTPEFEDHLEYLYYTSKSVPAFLTSCVLPLSALSTASLELRFPAAAGYAPLDRLDSKLHLLAALSDLEMALLIAAARLDIVAHTDTVNFAMAYDEYVAQMGKQRVQQSSAAGVLALGAAARTWGRGVAAVAWERLISLGLLLPAGLGGRSNAAHGGLEGKMWKLDVALEEIPPAVELPGFLAKWCSQI